jgi:hypothetical protein
MTTLLIIGAALAIAESMHHRGAFRLSDWF